MYELYPYYTNDGSVGLFSPTDDDIYHSTYGAYTESCEKFIIPANINNYIKNNLEIKILDICFGIGYNSKSFIQEVLKNYYNDTIGGNNVKYNDKLYTNNKYRKIYIRALDIDKNLATLSPFFKTFEKDIGKINSQCKFFDKHPKIVKFLDNTAKENYKFNKEINVILLKELIDQIDVDILDILNNKKYKQFFDKEMIGLFEFYKNKRVNNTSIWHLNTFLHNIYYKYISTCNKKALKALKNIDLTFNLIIGDARQSVIRDNNKYNFIFLDAFTPTKCPCLWTVDFFKELYNHLEPNGMILTYSTSANIRNALINAGFNIGKISQENCKRITGTVAVKGDLNSAIKNSDLIHELSEFDLGLIKTKAGIFYRDKNLNLANEAIINNHKVEVENSDLMSSTKYNKMYSRN